jgi:outer membrane protein TolC
MAALLRVRAFCATATGLLAGCSSPFDDPSDYTTTLARTAPSEVDRVPESAFRERAADEDAPPLPEPAPTLSADSGPEDYLRYALFHNPDVEAAYQRWRVAAERLPQVSALPDPRLNFGYYLVEVQTRTGPQEARLGFQQTVPWPGKLKDKEDAASRAAVAMWRHFEAARLAVSERVISSLHDLEYLDATISITSENLELLRSFEEVLRARYRVGAGSHPELIRVQVELGLVEDRLAQLRAMRPVYVADLNAVLNRRSDAPVQSVRAIPARVASVNADELFEMALRSNPALLALEDSIEEQRYLAEVARKDGLPDLTVGLDYVFTGNAAMSSVPDSGEDPILLSFGINLPVWREKYDAGVREAVARRLVIANQREGQVALLAASIKRAWFEHIDADRRVRLYEQTLIPKAEESLRASLAGFRAGDTGFLDLLDTERTLLEFAVATERARADRGKALARLHTLVGEPAPTTAEPTAALEDESQGMTP